MLNRDGVTRYFRDEMQRAWADWTEAGVAMAGYNTEQNADDIEDLRRHLGVETINLWGISYGTHLALSVLKRHPERIGRVALASLEGQDQTIKRPARIDAYLDRVDGLMGQDPAVRAAVPNLSALMRRVHDRLEAQPATVTMAGATLLALPLLPRLDVLLLGREPAISLGVDHRRTVSLVLAVFVLGANFALWGFVGLVRLA